MPQNFYFYWSCFEALIEALIETFTKEKDIILAGSGYTIFPFYSQLSSISTVTQFYLITFSNFSIWKIQLKIIISIFKIWLFFNSNKREQNFIKINTGNKKVLIVN